VSASNFAGAGVTDTRWVRFLTLFEGSGPIESRCRDRSDVFSMPAGLAPADPYFATWTTNGHADAADWRADRPL